MSQNLHEVLSMLQTEPLPDLFGGPVGAAQQAADHCRRAAQNQTRTPATKRVSPLRPPEARTMSAVLPNVW